MAQNTLKDVDTLYNVKKFIFGCLPLLVARGTVLSVKLAALVLSV